MAVKPTVDPKWSTTNNPVDNIEPTASLKNGGVPAGGVWGREFLNWQFFAISQWIDWVRSSALDKDNNLSDLTSVATARKNLGLNDTSVTLGANIATANALKTTRTINGTSFNGTANITTATWGASRKLNGVDVNGSVDKILEPYVERDDTTNASRFLTFVDSSTAGYQRLNMDSSLAYNPSTNVLNVNASNAATATSAAKWTTARTITLGGDLSGSASIDGSANVTLSAQVGDNSHNHTYLSGTVSFSGSAGNNYDNSNITVNGNGSANTIKPSIGFHQPGLYAGTLSQLDGYTFQFKDQSGGAAVLANNISGSAANWTTARTLTIAGSGKSVNGSGNVTWSLADLKLDALLFTNGCQKLPSGVIIQWGSVSVGGNNTATVTFPLVFPTACRSVIPNAQWSGDGGAENVSAYSFTTANFTLVNGWGSATAINWIAIGH